MHLFTYGTLMAPTIFNQVTGTCFACITAWLYHYIRFRVKGETYPGIRPRDHAVVEGVIYSGVDNASLHKLDRFEGPLYNRTDVIVHLGDGTPVDAQAYVIRPEFADRLTSEPWSFEKFLKCDRDEVRRSYSGFNNEAE